MRVEGAQALSTWHDYLRNSLGVSISAVVCSVLTVNIAICMALEKRRLKAEEGDGVRQARPLRRMKRLWSGMLIGYVVVVAAGVAQFILRFGYFSLLQEIGVVFLGLLGAGVGAVCALIPWRRRPA